MDLGAPTHSLEQEEVKLAARGLGWPAYVQGLRH